jgi:hypothetical protein
VTRVQDPTERFSEVVGSRIEDARDMSQDDVVAILPILNGKVLDKDVTRAFSGNARILHVDGRFVVAVDRCGLGLWKTELG